LEEDRIGALIMLSDAVEIALIMVSGVIIPATLNYRISSRAASAAERAAADAALAREAATHAGEVAHRVDAKIDTVDSKLDSQKAQLDGQQQKLLDLQGSASYRKGTLDEKADAEAKADRHAAAAQDKEDAKT
jgi:hypothetical protein